MTRYLCVHPTHEREGRLRPVDLSPQVRLERAFAPRSSAYLALTEDVVRGIAALQVRDAEDRVSAVRRVITGTQWPLDAPVVLVSERRVRRSAGLYELDELRASERPVDELVRRSGTASEAGSDDLVVLLDGQEPTEPGTPAIGATAPDVATAMRTAPPRTRVIPQGVFPVESLAVRLAQTSGDEVAIVDAIRSTPTYSEPRSERAPTPWRVVVECPVAAGEPPLVHRTVFTGTGEPEPAVVLGTPAEGTWDAVLADAAAEELAPSVAVGRARRRLLTTVLVELAIVALLAVLGWLSGGMATALRETPGWFGFGVALAVSAIAAGAFGLFAPGDVEGDPNDTLVLRRFYDSRIDLLWWTTIVSAGLFAAALVVTLVPPALVSEHVVPSPTITFDTSRLPVTAEVRLDASGLPTDGVLIVDIRQFGSGDTTGTLVGRSSATGNASGTAQFRQTVALDQGAEYLAVTVVREGDAPPTCTPALVEGPGCTIVSVPPLGAGVTIVPIQVTAPSVVPSVSPSVSVTPSASVSVSPSLSPSASVSASPSVSTSPSL